jgi:hypothetical protein
MQYVNDDMDDLFRRAAENYPLDTSNADWNKVLTALQNENGQQKPSKKSGNGRFLWLLLLLPLGFLCNRLYSPGNESKNISSESAVSTSASLNSSANSHTSNTMRPETNKTANSNANADLNGTDLDLNGGIAVGSTSGFTSKNLIKKTTSNSDYSAKPASTFMLTSSGIGDNQEVSKATAELFVADRPGHINYPIDGLFSKENFSPVVPGRLPVPIANPAQPGKKQLPSKEKGFYAGFTAGMDITTVKFQKIVDKGASYGLLLGYQINKKWSIESGVSWDKKYYYSDGKYYNTAKLQLPYNTKVTEVTGDCKMIEVPLNVRYTIASSKLSSWFAVAGASSYLMKGEDYSYVYYYGSSGTYVTHYKEYNSSSRNLFSVVQLSGGYTRSIGKIGDLRFEPYLKLPLTGMGAGDLPLLSGGLQVGFIKKF